MVIASLLSPELSDRKGRVEFTDYTIAQFSNIFQEENTLMSFNELLRNETTNSLETVTE